MPSIVVEVLRLCIILLLSACGYELGRVFPEFVAMGPLDPAGVGAVLGVAVGYVLGGVVARTTGRTLRAAEVAILTRSPEQVLAGLVGSLVGITCGTVLAAPLLLVHQVWIALPTLVFVCVSTGTLGYRVGLARRGVVLSLFGPRAGLVLDAPLPALPRVLDSSVAVDGRVVDVIRAGFLHGTMLVPQPVLDELQGLADSPDELRRARGRRALAVLETLRRERGVDLEVIGDEAPQVPQVDGKLVRTAIGRDAVLLTLDSNLARAAALAGCHVMNLHALALALRPPVAAGDTVQVLLTRAGKEPGQAVGYLDDGTMLVLERARDRIGSEVSAVVTSVLTTANGRMVFARPAGPAPASGPTAPAGPTAPLPRPR